MARAAGSQAWHQVPARQELVIRTPDHGTRGAGRARNAGVSAATGEVVCFLDDDDVVLVPHVLSVLQAFHADPGLGYVKTRVHIDEGLRVHDEWRASLDSSLIINLAGMARVTPRNRRRSLTGLWVWCLPAVRRPCLEFVGGFLELPGAGGEDVAMNRALGAVFRARSVCSFRCSAAGRLTTCGCSYATRRVEEPTVEYRMSPGSTFAGQLRKFQHAPGDLPPQVPTSTPEQPDQERQGRRSTPAEDDPHNPTFAERIERLVGHLVHHKLRRWRPPVSVLGVWLPAYETYGLL